MECTSCGRTNRAGARFCDGCGAALTGTVAAGAEARKVVTIVFADLVGSTSLHERLDAESARRFMDRYYRALQGAVDAHGGALVKLLGDGVMAAFGVPRVAEDDAIRAVRAAVAMQRAVRELAREPAVGDVGLRVGVNTGEVVVSDDHGDVVGDPVNVAARLQQEAHDGDVLIGEPTRRLVSHLVTLAPFGVLALKGRSETVSAYRVASLDRPASAPIAAFVGRDDELRRFTRLYDDAVAAPGARLAVLLGSPGLGKSRLLAEVASLLGGRTTVLAARCDAAGGATFAPIAEALRVHLDVHDAAAGDARAAIDAALPPDEPDRGRIANGITGLLAGTPASPEETFFVVRRFLATLARTTPVLLAIDDVQWAEPVLLDLIEHLAQWGGGAPLLVLVAARPELRALRPSLARAGGVVSDVVTLAGLDAGAATRLAANVIGAAALPAAVAGRVLAASEGNPLFVGELVRMLVHDGALRREGERWTAGVELSDLEMPPTIQALLAARIERLPLDERTVLERAAVVGRHFSRGAVADLLEPAIRADLDTRLESLRRSELIEPDVGKFLGEPGLRFHHVLVRDAAYRRLLKGTRAALHGRVADWLESRAGEAVEQQEAIGWHLEQAHQHLRELGPIDAQGRAFGERAARHLSAAGRRALARDDLPPAASLLGRAIDRLDDADPGRAELALDWCEALLAAGHVASAARAVDELARFTSGSERLTAWHTCFAGQLAVLTDPQALRATADAVARAAGVLASAGDAAGEAKAHAVHATAVARLGKMGACEAALDLALAAARRARDRRRASSVLAGAPVAALWGPSPVARASGRCLDVVRVLRITQGAPAVEAVALRCQAVLEALRGRADAARRMIASSRRMVEELGITPRLLEADLFAGLIELLEGDAGAAERSLRVAYEGLRANGLGIDAAQAAALLGRALLAQGRPAEAETLSYESEALAGDDLKAAIAWRGVRAEALARRGEHAAALEFARAAVELAAVTDALLDHADARMALAEALGAAGRAADADAERAQAISLWETKGASLLVERARRGHAGHDAAPARPHGRSAVRRRVRPNAATASAAGMDAAVALATLGDALALCRRELSLRALDDAVVPVGEADMDTIVLLEVDAAGKRVRTEHFAVERLADAVAALYARYATLVEEGPEAARAATTARAVAALLQPPDVDRYAGAVAPGIEYADRRALGLGSGRGAELFLLGLRSLVEVSAVTATRVDDVVALTPDAVLMRWTSFGTDRAGGGTYERPLLLLWVFGGDGLLRQFEQFEVDHDDEAFARFDELTEQSPVARFANAAARAEAEFSRRWEDRDWAGVKDSFDPAVRLEDRRALVGVDLTGAEFESNLRILYETPASRWRTQLLATRGERLALLRVRFTAEIGDGGALADEHLSLVEYGPDGRKTAVVGFDLDATDDAYAELDERFARGEGAPYAELLTNLRAFQRASAARDWDTVARLLPDDFTLASHRRLVGTDAPIGRAQYLATRGSVDDLGIEGDLRTDHCLRLSAPAAVVMETWFGTIEGGRFEDSFLLVASHDGRHLHACDIFDVDAVDAAFARHDELAGAAIPLHRHAATTQEFRRAFAERDWAALADTLAADLVVEDHRVLGWEELRGPAAYVEALRSLVELAPDVRLHIDRVIATSPDAVLYVPSWVGTREGGAFEAPSVIVAEFDGTGRIRRFDQYDLDRLDEARARLDAIVARAAAGDAATLPSNAAPRTGSA